MIFWKHYWRSASRAWDWCFAFRSRTVVCLIPFIAQKTKRLARKQMGWFGRDPRIHWLQALNPALLDNAMAIIGHADAGDYDAIDAQADAYTQHHLGDID